MQYLRAFGAFWYDFLVGDKWELFVGPILVLAIAWGLVQMNVGGEVTGSLIFVGLCVVMLASLTFATRRRA